MSPADLIVRQDLVIPAAELRESASRAGGPGGQNVNKTSTRVTLRWSVAKSAVLTEARRAQLLRRLASRLTRRGELIVHARRHRSRSHNRELARERIGELVREALAVRRHRVPTRPSRAVRARTVAQKKRRGVVKRQRHRVDRSHDDS